MDSIIIIQYEYRRILQRHTDTLQYPD